MAITYVGERGTGAATQANPATLSVSSNATAGNTIILILGCRNQRNLPSGVTITDSRSNTWNLDNAEEDNSLNNLSLIASTKQDGGTLQSGDTITVTFGTAPTGNVCYFLEEFSGIQTSAYALDRTGQGIDDVTTNGATVTVGSTTRQGVELAIVGMMVNGGPGAVTRDATWSNFTTSEQYDTVTGKSLDAQYQIQASKGTPSATYTWTSQGSSRVITTYFSVVNGHILTEGGDYIDTEGSDRLVTEDFVAAGGTLNATAGSVAVTGSQATLAVHRVFTASAGSIAVTGASATPNVKITATAGSAAINGTAATFAIHRTLSAAAGSVTVTGAAATPNVGITASAGSVAINGSPVTPAPKITATAGAVAVTGFQATLAVHRVFSALPGTFTITGDNATPNVAITASAGSVAINGTAATPAVAITASAGAVVITGSPVTFSGLHAYTLNATAASVTVSGNAATLTKQTAGGGGATPTDGGAVEQQRISQYVSRLRAEDDLVTVLAGL